jgi:hypothetical protein
MEITKNKKLTYFLICAVAVVWGVILHRVFFSKSEEDYKIKESDSVIRHEPYDQYVIKEDTFKLALNYRDPFLGEMPPVSEPKPEGLTTIKQVSFVPPQVAKPVVDWSVIKYSGYIINPITKKTVCIITVNGNERMLAEGESFAGAQLLKNKKDSVLISWKGKEKYIKQ